MSRMVLVRVAGVARRACAQPGGAMSLLTSHALAGLEGER